MVSEKKSMRTLVLFLGLGAVIIAAIIIVPGYFNIEPNSKNTYRYNFFEFVKHDGIWSTQTQEGSNLLLINLRHGPLELEDIPVKGDILKFRFAHDFFYITFDPRAENHDGFVTMANAEIAPNMVRHFGKEIAPSCIIEHPDCVGVPTVTCDNESAVIFLNRAEGPSVEIAGNCVIITGLENDIVRAADRFLYGMYGIMR